MNFQTTVLAGCTVGAAISGGNMQEQTAMHSDAACDAIAASDLVAVVIDGEIKLMTRQQFEDMDDLRANEEGKRSGAPTPYSEFRKELGL